MPGLIVDRTEILAIGMQDMEISLERGFCECLMGWWVSMGLENYMQDPELDIWLIIDC